ncbi:FixH family protein [Moraxella nasovis]|uniref:FixH family protein n=1 Tax=Moraxella nasovis TaxID=2904121 RepID=UPI001F603CEC|nr:FixH family protein [Moraxella nasovis]UNU73040.1 FixH family protein [Moraxella nasovis]
MNSFSHQNSTSQQKQAWYKNPYMTIFVVGLPVLVVVVCIFFIIYSINIQDSTVRDDWYMDGKTLYQDASRDKLAHDLGITGVMRFDGQSVLFELNFPKSAKNSHNDNSPYTYPHTLSAKFSHATDSSKDRDFTLTHTTANRYTGTVKLDDIPSKYYMHISNDGKYNWRLIHAQKLPAKNAVFMPLSAFDETKMTLPDQRNKRPTADANTP